MSDFENRVFVPVQPSHSLQPKYNMPAVDGAVVKQLNPTQMKALVSQTAASATLTLASYHVGDVLTVSINGVTVAVTAATDLNTTTAALATAINANATLAPVIKAVAASAVITLTALNAGIGGNCIPVSIVVTGAGATMTGTFAPTTGFLGSGVGSLTPQINATIVVGRSLVTLTAGIPINSPSPDLIAAIQASAIPCL